MSCPFIKAHSSHFSVPRSFKDAEDAGMTKPSMTAQVYSRIISGDSMYNFIDVNGSDHGTKAELHKETAEDKLGM
jgi:hypothetical protein